MSTPQIPDEFLAKVARRATARMARTDRPFLAERVLGITAHRVRDRRLKADLLGAAADTQLSRGLVPRHLVQAYGAELACADADLKAGRKKEAAASCTRALQLAFHRAAHFDGYASPLAADPGGFTAPLRRSRTLRAMRSSRTRAEQAVAPPTDRPVRILFAHSGNDNFLPVITGHFAQTTGVETRILDTSADPALAPLANKMGRMAALALGAGAEYGRQAEAVLRPHLDWADVVFIDWSTAAAAFFTLVDPGTTRIVVRLHSYEAFSHWPQLTGFSRVDDVVFVSEHLRDLAVEAVPGLTEPDGPRIHVIDNAVSLPRFTRPKPPEARFALGLVGVGQVAKDPLWALEVLRLLRRRDTRYTLHLVGALPAPDASPAVRRYHDALSEALAPLQAAGAIRLLGPTEDVPAVLAEIGTILSTSLRESWHLGLVEGAASGAVPVVRDWPFFAGRPHGPRTLFPDAWVITTPAEAAERILALTSDEEAWRKAGHEASEHALAAWDWETVKRGFDRLLLGAER
ncbi:glycosyltransferase family 4 protein [Streptomyces sp. NBC_01320]|uniref:glycosyltransferase family 4 protein n=1 Tax=Streptomyces sp. NBC_01320 TaxID=2903824 RepID=UPI002E11E446|nr:glycosyltransferase family 4 protein [Streptomyces sp. NBC_01320]